MDKDTIDINWTPQELDSFLVDRYGFGLYPLAFIFEWINRVGDWSNWEHLPNREYVKDVIRKINSLKKKIINTMPIIEFPPFMGRKAPYDESNEEFLNRMNDFQWPLRASLPVQARTNWLLPSRIKKVGLDLEKFLDYLDIRKRFYEQLINKRYRGSSIKRQNLIPSLWAHVIRDTKKHIKETDWDIIADILKWFSFKLNDYEIYKKSFVEIEKPIIEVDGLCQEMVGLCQEIEIEENTGKIVAGIDCQYLKTEFFRTRERIYDIFEFIKFRFFDNNFYKPRSIVIFGDKYSTSIEHDQLDKDYKNPINKKKLLLIFDMIQLNKRTDIPDHYSNIVIQAYRGYAANLYKENLDNPPKIILPDFSFI